MRGPHRRKRSFFSSWAYDGHDARAKAWPDRGTVSVVLSRINVARGTCHVDIHCYKYCTAMRFPTLFSCFRINWFRFARGTATIQSSKSRPHPCLHHMSI